MSEDTPTVVKPTEGAQPAPAGEPSALPEAEITRLTDEIVTALKTSTTRKFRLTSTRSA
jgi:hypothetical protein